MKTCTLVSAIAALSLSSVAAADIVDVGLFSNSTWGNVSYDGDFRRYFTVAGEESGEFHYTVVTLDMVGLLRSIGAEAFISVSVKDSGVNTYGSAPGADMDLFVIDGLASGIETTYSYVGPTPAHQNEGHTELFGRASTLNWGTGGRGIGSHTFVSLGKNGVLTATLSDAQEINPGGGDVEPISLVFSEVGTAESFRIFIETTTVPAPSALALLGLSAFGRARRRRV